MTNQFLPGVIERCHFDFGCQAYVLRDDLIHSEISGNKYRKLKHVMASYIGRGAKGIITFGGPFSNHIYSTAAYCKLLGLESVGIIRGEDDKENPTLNFVRSKGMKLQFVPRSEYRLKIDSSQIRTILNSFPEYGLLNEGGEHPLAFDGLKKIVDDIEDHDLIPDFIALSAGTGITAAGILRAVCDKKWETKVVVLSPMKNNMLAHKIITKAERDCSADQLIFIDEFAGTGYAKASDELIRFMHKFYTDTQIKLDPVYTGKLVFGLHQLSQKGFFNPNDKLVWIHTGGLQGIEGYNFLNHKLGKSMSIQYGQS
jgi:1-aminocyclopropane-1-carboxylate deaminase